MTISCHILVSIEEICTVSISFKITCTEVTNALVGNGFCNDETNNIYCNYDGGDCCGTCVNTKHCNECECLDGVVSNEIHHALVGNGVCDEETNNEACNFDGGECCGPHLSCKATYIFTM